MSADELSFRTFIKLSTEVPPFRSHFVPVFHLSVLGNDDHLFFYDFEGNVSLKCLRFYS